MRAVKTAMVATGMLCLASAGWAQSVAYWLIKDVRGQWEYRVGTEAPQRLEGRYEPLFPAAEVRCLETDLQRCELRYLPSPQSTTTEKLPVKLTAPARWVSLKTMTPPIMTVPPVTPSDLAARFTRATRPGGSRGGSGCGGDVALRSPVCGDTIDVDHFTVRWRGLDAGRVTILVERVDGAAALFRGSAAASAGEFQDPSLAAFLQKLQSEGDVVDVTLHVLAEGGRSALRLVHVPPKARSLPYRGRVTALGRLRGTGAMASRLALALDEGMWSSAGEIAREMMRPPAAASALEYAAIGLCRSGFDEERALVQKSVPPARYKELCRPAEAATSIDAGTTTAGPVTAEETQPSAQRRVGLALLIGNSDYWNLPLKSVKSDLEGMRAALHDAGFTVTIKENLRSPRHFVESLDDMLRKENATSDDVLLVYYSGHGLQLDGKAHLLSTGVSASARVTEDLRDNAQSTEDLLAQMERALPGTRILVVDACRDNVLSSGNGDRQITRGGFAFQQDDVANTFVMFANRPGQTAPLRSDYGLMGPFTESLVYALQSSSGDILDVFQAAARKTSEISPGQDPVLYHSKTIDHVVLKREGVGAREERARSLLNRAAPLYQARAWDEFLETVTRARALTSDAALAERLSGEADFGRVAAVAETAESTRRWADAAAAWQHAADLFPARHWVAMRAAIAWLMADETVKGARTLAPLARLDGEAGAQATRMLAALTKDDPSLEAEARDAAEHVPSSVAAEEFPTLPGTKKE